MKGWPLSLPRPQQQQQQQQQARPTQLAHGGGQGAGSTHPTRNQRAGPGGACTPDTQSEGGPRGGLHTRHAIRGRAQGGLAHPTRNQGAGPGGACTPNTQSGGGPPRGGWSAVGGGGVMTNAPVSDITKDPITRITRN